MKATHELRRAKRDDFKSGATVVDAYGAKHYITSKSIGSWWNTSSGRVVSHQQDYFVKKSIL